MSWSRPGSSRRVGDEAAPVAETAEHDGVGRTRAIVHHGVGLDRRMSLSHPGHRRSLVAVDRRLIHRGVLGRERPARRRRRIDAGRLLGDVVAVGGHHPHAAWLRAHLVHHLGDRMRDVVVAGAAEVGQPARYGQTARVVLRDAHLRARDLHGGGKAAVEIELVDAADAGPSHCQRLPGDDAHGGRGMKVVPVGDVPVIVRVGAAVQVDPSIPGNAELTRLADRRQDDRRGLVDEGVRVHQLGVGKTDVGVVRADGGNLLGAETLPAVCQGVGLGHAGKVREQLADGGQMLRHRTLQVAANAVLEQRISVDRARHAVAIFQRAPAPGGDAPRLWARRRHLRSSRARAWRARRLSAWPAPRRRRSSPRRSRRASPSRTGG